MKTLEDMDKRMPFRESKDYLDSLVNQATEAAIAGRGASRRFPFAKMAASIAIALFAGGAGWLMLQEKPAAVEDSPLNSFLCHISDEEAEQITYYDLDAYDLDDYIFESE